MPLVKLYSVKIFDKLGTRMGLLIDWVLGQCTAMTAFGKEVGKFDIPLFGR